MKSKTKIEKQAKRKLNPELVETIFLAKKNKNWIKVAEMLTRPKKKFIRVNLNKINKEVKEGEKIVVPGKILGGGNLQKKIKIIAFSFSNSAIEKIKKANSEFSYIKEEIKINPEAKNLRIFI